MDQTLNSGKKQLDRAVNQSGDVVRNATSALHDQGLMDQANEWFQSAESIVSDVAKKSTDIAKRYPMRSLLAAVACGFLLATIFRSSKD